MKDFENTIAFVRDFNSFGDIVSMLRINDKNKLSDSEIEALTDDMKKYCDKTSCRGEELAGEVKGICTDVLDLSKYVLIWESQLNEINTAWMEDEDTFNDDFWKARIGEYHACAMFGLLSGMRRNYVDVMNSMYRFKNSYGLNEVEGEERRKQFIKDQEERNNVEISKSQFVENGESSTTEIPHDILRLFGNNKAKYQEYIEDCKGRCAKEIARLYTKHGKIPFEQERIATLLFKHLKKLKLLDCKVSNFQKHCKFYTETKKDAT